MHSADQADTAASPLTYEVVLTDGACGHCNPCSGGHGAYCKDFFGLNFGGGALDGSTAIQDPDGTPLHDHFFAQSSFATYALSRENNAIKVPDDAPIELLGPLGCGIQTGAGAVINSLKVTAGSSFASFGAGAVGQHVGVGEEGDAHRAEDTHPRSLTTPADPGMGLSPVLWRAKAGP